MGARTAVGRTRRAARAIRREFMVICGLNWGQAVVVVAIGRSVKQFCQWPNASMEYRPQIRLAGIREQGIMFVRGPFSESCFLQAFCQHLDDWKGSFSPAKHQKLGKRTLTSGAVGTALGPAETPVINDATKRRRHPDLTFCTPS